MAVSQGLPISRLVNVTVNLTPAPVAVANFDTSLIVGDSDVIDPTQRLRSYGTLSAVAGDFGLNAPEYLAASLHFGQTPQPSLLFIGRWVAQATEGINVGSPLSAAEMVLSQWTTVTTGSFTIFIDGVPHNVTGLSFATVTNLNGVASAITAQLAGAATCTWNGQQFQIESYTTGPTSSVGYMTPQGTGHDLSAQLHLNAVLSQRLVPGVAAETILNAVTILDTQITYWYFVSFATTTVIADQDYLAVATYIEGSTNKHMMGVTTPEGAALTSGDTTSIGALLEDANYSRSAAQWSSTNKYAITSLFGRACTVDFTGSNTAITLAWKQEPGVNPEYLGSSEADALDSNNYTYLAQFTNATAVTVNGKVASGFFIDEVWGVDWLANNIQVGLFNLLFQQNKVPQTDAGMHLLVNVAEASCVQGVNNGLIAATIPGGQALTWNGPTIGALNTGDPIPKGFYVFVPPMATQNQADRAARKSPLMQVAVKLAGAIHTVNALITVNQ